jgi:hypothetical protein
LRMDFREKDTEGRVLNYYVLFDQVIEENGLEGMVGSGRANEASLLPNAVSLRSGLRSRRKVSQRA